MAKTHSSGKNKTTVAGIAIAILIALYGLLRPTINDATGWSLPAIAQTQSDRGAEPAPSSRPSQNSERATRAETSSKEREVSTTASSGGELSRDGGTLADAMPERKTRDSAASGDAVLTYGLLREVERDRYVSPAGLLYTPGSAEGHRLEHLRRHIEDQPSRPGKHGVFDGGMEGALRTIDQAYENAKIGKRTNINKEDGRTIYIVDLGHRVGFVGGREGNQKHKPMARRVQLVLDGNRFITAYPL